MKKYGVNITLRDLFYEVEAENEEEAIGIAHNLAYDAIGNLWDLDPYCNECFVVDDEEE